MDEQTSYSLFSLHKRKRNAKEGCLKGRISNITSCIKVPFTFWSPAILLLDAGFLFSLLSEESTKKKWIIIVCVREWQERTKVLDFLIHKLNFELLRKAHDCYNRLLRNSFVFLLKIDRK